MFFDPLYLIILGPGLIFSLWASFKVKRTFKEYSETPIASALSGAEVAREILRRGGISNVQVEETQGWLSDHYHPVEKVVRLSPEVYHGRSISSVGVAAHETGHALQDAQGYRAMAVRQSLIVPANIGSYASYIVIVLGFFMQLAGLIWLGILLFSAVVLFQLVTLPVEFNASARAKTLLVDSGIITRTEADGVGAVLSAAAMTYVAALVSSILTLVYYIIRFGGVGRSSDD